MSVELNRIATRFSIMCIPIGGFSGALITPSEKAKKLGDYLKIAVSLHFTLALFMFLGGRWFDGAFDLLASLIGYMSIRHSEGYSLQQVLCYTIFCGMDFFFAIIRAIMFFAKVVTDIPSTPWMMYIYIGTLIVAPLIYALCCTLGYQVYKELRLITIDLQESGVLGAPPSFYGGGAVASSRGSSNMWSHPEIHPGEASSAASSSSSSSSSTSSGRTSSNMRPGFKPFSGQGHRLGGT